jgi:hypothetical protein
MSKILKATCAAGVVIAEDDEVPVDADILSEGVGDSEGLLILNKNKATYITSNASDLKTDIEKTVDALTKCASSNTTLAGSLTAIAGALTALANPVPTLLTDATTLTANAAAINVAIGLLNTLKGTLK